MSAKSRSTPRPGPSRSSATHRRRRCGPRRQPTDRTWSRLMAGSRRSPARRCSSNAYTMPKRPAPLWIVHGLRDAREPPTCRSLQRRSAKSRRRPIRWGFAAAVKAASRRRSASSSMLSSTRWPISASPIWRCLSRPSACGVPSAPSLVNDYVLHQRHAFRSLAALWDSIAGRFLGRRNERGDVERWNSTVGPDDEVWHLGDFAIRQRPAIVAEILVGCGAASTS